MAYVIRRPQTLSLLDQLAAESNLPKIEVIHRALIACGEAKADRPSLWEIAQADGHALRNRGRPDQGQAAEKEFIDALYED